jgi:uncharacterized protein (DUF1501 family)
MSHSRRDFLVRTTCAALGAAAFQGTVRQFGLANLLATQNTVGGNYRALVCVFMNGGNDANNMVIPNDAGYAAYSAARTTAGLAIPQANLLPLNNPPSMAGQAFGLNPNMPEIQNLFNTNKLSVVCNVGTLVHPMTQAEYINNSVPKPFALFSHSDQIQAGQSGRADIKIATGWGGRASDATLTCNAGSAFPTVTSISGSSTFCIGLAQRPLSIGTGALNTVLVLNGFNSTPESVARKNSMDFLRTIDQTATMIAGASATTQQGLDIGAAFSVDPVLNTVFPATGIGNQLKQVAKVMKLNQTSGSLNLERQIFFVSQGGYDTHQDQITGQGNNFADLSAALSAFYNATIELGLQNNITTFTLSDFGRTLQPSGSGASVGSDHGWGNHQFVMGDSVLGGNFYGTVGPNGTVFPTLQTGGPDDTSNTGRGRWIPTSSVDQYGATLAKWFGVADIDQSTVFPLIGNFPTADLAFMGAPPAGC